MFQENEEEEEGGTGSMSSLAFLREKAPKLESGKKHGSGSRSPHVFCGVRSLDGETETSNIFYFHPI